MQISTLVFNPKQTETNKYTSEKHYLKPAPRKQSLGYTWTETLSVTPLIMTVVSEELLCKHTSPNLTIALKQETHLEY